MDPLVVSTIVRALRELTGPRLERAEDAKGVFFELTVKELDSAIETLDELTNLARECSAFLQIMRNSSLGAKP